MCAVDTQYYQNLSEKFLVQYDENADVWSGEEQMRAFASFALQPPNLLVAGTRAIDVGAGRGRDTLFLLERGFRVVALDLFRMPEWSEIEKKYPGLVEFASEGLLNYEPSVDYEQAALVIDNGCYHHQSKDVQSEYLAKINRMLLLGGRLAINVFACRGKLSQETIVLKDGRPLHVYDENKIRSEISAAGFLVSQVKIALRPDSAFPYDYLYVNAEKVEE